MKKQSTTFLTQLGAEKIVDLTTIVSETLAMEYKAPAPKVFTAAELWNIQKQKKAISPRRYNL
jgi:hypothetical protein